MKLYKNCSELPLKVYCNVVNDGNPYHIIYEGICETEKDHALVRDTWYEILKEYAKLDAKSGLGYKLEDENTVKALISEHTAINGALFYLMYQYDQDLYDFLKNYGYHVEIKDGHLSMDSIKRNQLKSNKLITQIELLKLNFGSTDEEKEKTNGMDFDELVAWASDNLKFQIQEDVTVKRFLAYKKRINDKSKARKIEE